MKPDSELDMFLAHSQRDDEMESDAFVGAVMAGVAMRQTRRRVTVAVVGSLVAAAAVATCAVLPLPLLAAVHPDLRSVLAFLLLAALIAWAWLRTEAHCSVT